MSAFVVRPATAADLDGWVAAVSEAPWSARPSSTSLRTAWCRSGWPSPATGGDEGSGPRYSRRRWLSLASGGRTRSRLQAWPHNTGAIALYRRAGFVEEGVLRRHYRRRNGELWGVVVMGLLLDEEPRANGRTSSGRAERLTAAPLRLIVR